jgi:hypothetical protein
LGRINNPARTIPSRVIHSGKGVYVVFFAIGEDVGTVVIDIVVDDIGVTSGIVVSSG